MNMIMDRYGILALMLAGALIYLMFAVSARADHSESIFAHDMQGTARVGTMGALEVTVAQLSPQAPSFRIAPKCIDEACGHTLHLAWAEHPDPTVQGYTVFWSDTLIEAAMVQVDDVSVPTTAVVYNAWSRFKLFVGDQICFRLKAYNSEGSSGFSEGVCATM